MTQVVNALLLGLDPAWRRLPEEDRCRSADDFCRAFAAGSSVRAFTYSMVGLQPGGDLLVWRLAPSLESLEEHSAALLGAGLGSWMTVRESLLGLIQPSQYVRRPTPQEQSLFEGERSRYLIVYPFTKTAHWYRESRTERQRVMNEHMKIGHRYRQVRQLLAHSFGIDDQDFVVAYETDDLAAFVELVRELRGSESRLSTLRDTPILTAVRRPLAEITALLGA